MVRAIFCVGYVLRLEIPKIGQDANSWSIVPNPGGKQTRLPQNPEIAELSDRVAAVTRTEFARKGLGLTV